MNSKRISKSLFLLFSIILLLPCFTHATTLVFKDLNALINEADGIVAGTVNRIEYYYDNEGDISSLIHLTALNIIAGECNEIELKISQKGGKMGNEAYYIEGSPVFTEGDRVIVFLKDNGISRVPFVGWEQGVFKVKYFSELNTEGISDANDNVVSGINNNLILKETNNSKAFLVHRENTFDGYADDNTDSSRLLSNDHEKKIMKATDFINELKGKIKQNKIKKSKRMMSASITAIERERTGAAKRQKADVAAPHSKEPLKSDKATQDAGKEFLPQSSIDKE